MGAKGRLREFGPRQVVFPTHEGSCNFPKNYNTPFRRTAQPDADGHHEEVRINRSVERKRVTATFPVDRTVEGCVGASAGRTPELSWSLQEGGLSQDLFSLRFPRRN